MTRMPDRRLDPAGEVSTFSIVAIDRKSGEVGVAVASKFLAVGASVPWARAGVGAVATQAWCNVSYGRTGLGLLAEGLPAQDVLARLTGPDEFRHRRQVGVIDSRGRAASWTGEKCMAWAGHRVGDGYACQGNLLAGPEVIAAMAETFQASTGPLPERLLAVLDAGQSKGGDGRGQQGAALVVALDGGAYGGSTDDYVNLRVDDAEHPLEDLRALLKIFRLERPLQKSIDEFVTAAHHDLATVRSRIAAQPILVHARASWEENATEAAAHVGRTDIVEFMLSQGGMMDICTAAMLGRRQDVERFLKDDPSSVRAVGAHRIPVLYYPVIGGHREIAELLLARGADVNAGTGGTTPLHGAAIADRADLAEWLLNHGAAASPLNHEKKTPLTIAVQQGHAGVAKVLRAAGAVE
jgi:uncharacterized Ntn-hydrolase superfamily protein